MRRRLTVDALRAGGVGTYVVVVQHERVARRRIAPRAMAALSTGVTGVAGYLVLVVVGRTLSPPENADFLAVWGALFAAFTVVGGLGLQAAASVSATVSAGPPSSTDRVLRSVALPLLPALIGVGAVLGVVGSKGFALPSWGLPAILALGIGGYVGQTLTAGSLAGSGDWSTYGSLLITEALLRLGLVTLAVTVTGQMIVACFAVAAASMSWLAFLAVSPAGRRAIVRPIAEPTSQFRRRAASAALASVGPAILVVGYPFIVKAAVPSAAFEASAGVLLGVILTRAPFLVPLAVVQPLLVAQVSRSGRLPHWLIPGIVGTGLAGSVLGGLAGPAILGWVAPGSAVPWWVVSALVIDAALLAVMMSLAAASLARSRHHVYSFAWAVAVAGGVVPLFLSVGLEAGVIVGLTLGPVLGGVAILVATRMTGRREAEVPIAHSRGGDGLLGMPFGGGPA